MCGSTSGAEGAGRALGNVTEFTHGDSALSSSSKQLRREGVDSKGWQNNQKRGHNLRRAAGNLLSEPGRMHRTRSCCERRAKGPGGAAVGEVKIQGTDDHAWLSGVWRCASSWVCAVCAAAQSTQRRLEIESAVRLHECAGGVFALITLTVPHKLNDPLDKTLAALLRAKSLFTQRAAWQHLKRASVGTISTLEITHGRNGWHPHQHILVFVETQDAMPSNIKLYKSWAACCVKAGLEAPSEKHGLDMRQAQDGRGYAKYVEKDGNSWKVSNELTSENKKGRVKSSKTPFQLLKDYSCGNARAGRLFREYAAAVKGRAKTSWSRGLKERFAIPDKKKFLSAQDQGEVRLLGSVTQAGFSLIARYGAVGTLLSLCRSKTAVESLFDYLLKADGMSSRYMFSDLYCPAPGLPDKGGGNLIHGFKVKCLRDQR